MREVMIAGIPRGKQRSLARKAGEQRAQWRGTEREVDAEDARNLNLDLRSATWQCGGGYLFEGGIP